MHKYLIELQKYNEAGSLTSEYSYDTADTPQQLSDKVDKYNKMRYVTYDEDGHEITGGKMYKVTPKQGVYETITDFDAFRQMNAVLYH